MNQGLGQSYPLTIPFREPAHQSTGYLCQRAPLQDRIQGARDLFSRDALNPSHEFQIGAYCHVIVERGIFRQVAYATAHLMGFLKDVESFDADSSFGGRHEAGYDPHRRCFPCPIGAEETENLSPLGGERDILDGAEVAVVFR